MLQINAYGLEVAHRFASHCVIIGQISFVSANK